MLTQLSSELDRFSSEDLQHVLIILPTQRLGQYLLALLGKKRGSFIAPTILTLETWIHQHKPSHLEELCVLSVSAEELLLASLIKQGRYRHLQKGHEHEIREFFSQVDQIDFGNSVFTQLKNLIQKDIYRDDTHIGTLVERVEELSLLYTRYQSLLRQNKALTSEQIAKACVQKLCKTLKEGESSYKEIFFACFTTVKAYCKELLKILSKKENAKLFFSEVPQLLGDNSPLQDLLEYIYEKKIIPKNTKTLPLLKEKTRVIECSSLLSETQEAIATVKKFIQQGCPESRIGLLVTNERIYGKMLTSCLETESFQYNLAIAQPFSQSKVGSWLISLFKYLLSNPRDKKETQSLLQDFITHPWTWASLAPEMSEEEFQNLQYDLSLSDFDSEAHPLVQSVLKKLDALQLGGKREPLSFWQNAFMQVIEEFGFLDEQSESKKVSLHHLKSSDQDAFHTFCECFEQWTLCWKDKISGSECFFSLLDKIQNLETRSVGFPLEGVQILDLVEARYVPFEVLIVLGCTEGSFPRALPNDKLVGDMLKVRLGMPGWQYIEALEDTTFHLLCSQAKYFTFLYSMNPDYGSQSRSRFIQRILSEVGSTLLNPISHRELGFSKVEPTSSPSGIYSGNRQELFETISAKSLTQLFRCPYEFLLAKLGVHEKKEEDSSSLWEGRWLHEILEAFYTGHLQKKSVLEALPTRLVLSKEEILPYALERLQALTEHCLPASIKGSPFHLHLMHFAWPRFAEHWSKFFEEEGENSYAFTTQHSLKEYPLVGKGLPIDEGNDRWASLLGTLDSLDVHKHASILVDYKRKHVDSHSDVTEGLSPQLPLYALAMAQNRFRNDENFLDKCIVGYWSLLHGRWQARGVGKKAKTWALDKKLASTQTPDLHELTNTMQNLWSQTLSKLLDKNEDFEVKTSEHCEFCPFTGICRVEEGTLKDLKVSSSMSIQSRHTGLDI